MQPRNIIVEGQPDPLCCGCPGKVKVYVAAGYSILASAAFIILYIYGLSVSGFYLTENNSWSSVLGLLLHIGWLISSIILIVGVSSGWRTAAHGVSWQVFLWIIVSLFVIVLILLLFVGGIVTSELDDSYVSGQVWGIIIGVIAVPLALHLTFGILGTVGWQHVRRCIIPAATTMTVIQSQPQTMIVSQQQSQAYPPPGFQPQQGYTGYDQQGYGQGYNQGYDQKGSPPAYTQGQY